MKFHVITPEWTITLQTEPSADFWATHAAALEAMGIKDLGPVVDSEHAERIAKRAKRQYEASVAQAAANGGNLGKKSKGRK